MPKKQSATLTSPQVPRLLNIHQAAAYLACNVFALRQLQWNGKIPYLKIGKLVQFDRADLDRFIDAQKLGAARA